LFYVLSVYLSSTGTWALEKKIKGVNMDWIQFIIFAGGVFGCFFWNRSESRADIRHMDAKLDANRELVKAIHDDSKTLIMAMREEMKDFHGRLCTIEERNKK
jgi:hypothetical protein